jgi:hypothetical protein
MKKLLLPLIAILTISISCSPANDINPNIKVGDWVEIVGFPVSTLVVDTPTGDHTVKQSNYRFEYPAQITSLYKKAGPPEWEDIYNVTCDNKTVWQIPAENIKPHSTPFK